MTGRKLGLAIGLVVAGFLAGVQSADAAIVTNGSAIGANYTIQSIDAGVTVDFTTTTPGPANNTTIGKLTVTMGHSNVTPLGFTLSENAAAGSTSSASAGLRLLVDVKDTNGIPLTDWGDYHINAIDRASDVDAIRELNPNEGSHLVEAHFHDSTTGFASSPLVLQGSGDNVTTLNYGLGTPVVPGADFTATNILLHERDFVGFQREFQVTFAPSVPEPTSLALAGLAVAGIFARSGRRRV